MRRPRRASASSAASQAAPAPSSPGPTSRWPGRWSHARFDKELQMDDFQSALDQILEGEDVPSGAWEHLSALADDRELSFRQLWDTLTPSQRLGLLDSLHDESELDAHLDFTPIWRLALGDQTPRVRIAAIEYSADEEGQWLIDPLLKLCATDPDASVRGAAAEALARFAYLAEVGDLPARRG